MIISVSRRSDILAHYPDLFEKWVKEGSVEVTNPFNPGQKRKVSLLRNDVEGFVFWTRNALPSLHLLKKLEQNNYPFYLMITFTGYPKILEKNSPNFETAFNNFKILSQLFSKERVILRYDPILLSNLTDEDFHLKNFKKIADSFHKYTKRVIVSFFDTYKFALKRMKRVEGLKLLEINEEKLFNLLVGLRQISEGFSLEIQSCCEGEIFEKAGIKRGGCIDLNLFNNVFSLNLIYERDKSQRKNCLCHKSIDIGTYNTCPSQCLYCYANKKTSD